MLQILKFKSKQCAPCRAISGIVSEVAQQTNSELLTYDIDDFESKFTEFNVYAVPTLIFLKNGLEVGRKTGMMTKDALVKTIEELK